MRTAVVLIALIALAPPPTASAELRAGVARVDITPPVLMQMYGYANRKCGPANGTHDPLTAKALVLEAGGSRLAIVTMDLGSLVSDNLRREVASKLNIPVLLLSASHTHSAPSFLPFGSSPTTDPYAATYLAELERKIFSALEEAARNMAPATLNVGRGSLRLGYNRLLPRDDGRTRALFDNLERVPYGPVDPEYVLLRVDGADGAPARPRRALRRSRRRSGADQLQVLGRLSRRAPGEGRAGAARYAGDVRAGRRRRHQPAVHGAIGAGSR